MLIFRMIQPFPNTYTFTKRLAETVAYDYSQEHNIPLMIARPSIGIKNYIILNHFLCYLDKFLIVLISKLTRVHYDLTLHLVIPSLHEPVPGWVDSLNGPVGVMIASGKGVLRSMMVKEGNHCEVMPVDIAINILITMPWFKIEQGYVDNKIYNFTNESDLCERIAK